MLVLSRRVNEQIIIGDNIVVTVVAIRGSQVRLGIEAPSNVTVHRKEIYDLIRRRAAEQANNQPQAEPAHDYGDPA